jgi:hypothetical protein
MLDGPRSRLSLLFVLLLFILSASCAHSAASILEGTVIKSAGGDMVNVIEELYPTLYTRGETYPRQ